MLLRSSTNRLLPSIMRQSSFMSPTSTLAFRLKSTTPSPTPPSTPYANSYDLFGSKLEKTPEDDEDQGWQKPFIVMFGGSFLFVGIAESYRDINDPRCLADQLLNPPPPSFKG